jgi:Polysaccharide lyase
VEAMSRLPIAATMCVTLLILVTLAVTSAASKPPPRKSSPTDTALPSISGTPAVGATLQASSGTWQGTGISYSFQWQRCSSASSCAQVTGARGSSYLVGGTDSGHTLRVSVTAKSKAGSATAMSAPTAVVQPTSAPSSGYRNTALPAISGSAQAGQTLTVSNGSWSPTPSTYQYAWHRCQNGSCSVSPTSANQASYNVQPGDVGYTIVAEIAPAGNWSEAVDSQPTAAVTSAGPSGSVSFDGQANQMTQLYSTSATNQGQSPGVWTCLCFVKNDLSLVSDSTYGQAYKAAVATGDTNPWGGSSTTDGAAQLSVRRNNDLGKWDYYSFAVKVPSWNGPMSDLSFSELVSLGYQTSQSSQVALGLYGNGENNQPLSFSIDQNAGYTNNATGYATGSVHYNTTFMPVKFGQWEEFVIGVKWATDNTGALRVYNRVPGGSWSEVFDRENEATELYGSTPNGTFAADGSNWPTVIDKMGLYFQEDGGESETVYESGLTRSSDLTTAESALP